MRTLPRSATGSGRTSRQRGLDEPEAARGQVFDFIIVIEDDPAEPRHAKILEQKVAGEDVRRGQILDALAVIENRRFRASRVILLDEEIQRSHAALGIYMFEDDVIALGADDTWREAK